MTRLLLAPAALAAILALAAAPAHAQFRLAPPVLSLPPAPPMAGVPEPLRFRAPWELPATERRAAAADTARSRGPAAPGACRMPVLGEIGGAARDAMPVFRPDTAVTAPPMRVITPRACTPGS